MEYMTLVIRDLLPGNGNEILGYYPRWHDWTNILSLLEFK